MSVKKVRSSNPTHIYFVELSKPWKICPKLVLTFASNT
jgi:hypothetical protein